jgi:hypothetical protein
VSLCMVIEIKKCRVALPSHSDGKRENVQATSIPHVCGGVDLLGDEVLRYISLGPG